MYLHNLIFRKNMSLLVKVKRIFIDTIFLVVESMKTMLCSVTNNVWPYTRFKINCLVETKTNASHVRARQISPTSGTRDLLGRTSY